jgi:hypothetical protein
MMMNLAYAEGQAQAEEEFGLRTAGDAYKRGIPHGDMNVSAERLAKHLSSMDSGVSLPKDERKKRFGNPVRWGGVTTPYGTGTSSHDYSGIGRDGAAI